MQAPFGSVIVAGRVKSAHVWKAFLAGAAGARGLRDSLRLLGFHVAGVCVNLDAYLTRWQAHKATGVSRDTIGKWRARGWVGQDGQRRQLRTTRQPDGTLRYRLGDLLEAERDTRMSKQSPRYARNAPAATT